METGSLYVVATPIGNLRDITLRALDVLKSVDIIAAEDTRNSAHLLQHYGIATQLTALHEHNERAVTEKLLARLGEGKSIALISDAGTPAISDPGSHLVKIARQRGFRVTPIPGPSAATAAVSAAGTDSAHYLFYGFLPAKPAARRKALQPLAHLPYTLIFYEAPHRILECVDDLAAAFGPEREVTFARELTKLFETLHTCRLEEARPWLEGDAHRQKGEFVLVVEAYTGEEGEAEEAEALRILQVLLLELPLKQAVKLAAEITGQKKNHLYEQALEMRAGEEDT
jgi:probable S-adenosylmethionine-dependent methyltransferase, YraL family